MALLASSVFPSTPKFQVKLLENQFRQCHRGMMLFKISPMCSMKTTTANFDEPSNVKLKLAAAKERLLNTIPEPVKEFPWKKAEDVLLKQLLFVGQKAMKWCLVVLFVLSSLSDVVYSIARNKELMIPAGLFVGYLMADFFKEISLGVFQSPEENGLNLSLVGIGCVFVLVKIISSFFAPHTRVFLLHVANGGLMQVMWLSRHFFEDNNTKGHGESDSAGRIGDLSRFKIRAGCCSVNTHDFLKLKNDNYMKCRVLGF